MRAADFDFSTCPPAHCRRSRSPPGNRHYESNSDRRFVDERDHSYRYSAPGDRGGGSSGYQAAAFSREAQRPAGRGPPHHDDSRRFDGSSSEGIRRAERQERPHPQDEWGRGVRGGNGSGAQEPAHKGQPRDAAGAAPITAPAAASARADQFADSDEEEEEAGGQGAGAAADTSALPMVPAGLEHLSEEELLAQLMGLQGFDSSKGQEVSDNKHGAGRGAVRKNQVRKHRQYMNRKDGFNRPLDKIK